jgi:hypothetical protein
MARSASVCRNGVEIGTMRHATATTTTVATTTGGNVGTTVPRAARDRGRGGADGTDD